MVLDAVRRSISTRLERLIESDVAFVERAFQEILGRPADQGGLDHYVKVLRSGVGRTSVVLQLAQSDEFRARVVPPTDAPLPSLVARRPEHYRRSVDQSNGQSILTFRATTSADFDWLEGAIIEHQYYEKPGVWQLHVDFDKQLIAEIVASFRPNRALDIGCASGAVIDCLSALDVEAEGVEISRMAIATASEQTRKRIHCGDLLSLSLPRIYDVVVGLDIFEHLNPNRLGAYLERLSALTQNDGLLFCNIPAFGDDPVFGTVFPFYLPEWTADEHEPFAALHTDELGYPLHGHLIWATANWWVRQFQRAGFTRQVDIERALHRVYDDYMTRRSPARRAYFVFGKQLSNARRAAVIRRIDENGSTLLRGRS